MFNRVYDLIDRDFIAMCNDCDTFNRAEFFGLIRGLLAANAITFNEYDFLYNASKAVRYEA